MRGFLLTLTAILLSILTLWMGLLFTCMTLLVRGRLKHLNSYFFDIAVAIDQLGNVVMRDLFNVLFITSNSAHLFGDEDEVISSVLGKNQKANTLTVSGKMLVTVLHWIDPNHAINSIEHREMFRRKTS